MRGRIVLYLPDGDCVFGKIEKDYAVLSKSIIEMMSLIYESSSFSFPKENGDLVVLPIDFFNKCYIEVIQIED